MKILKIIADFFRSLFCKKSTEQKASSPETSPAQTPCEEAKTEQTTEAQPEQQPATDAPSVSDAAPEQSATSDNDDNTIPQAQNSLFEQIATHFKQILKFGKQNVIKVSVIDGPCNFSDFLAWFKSKNLDPKKHTAFIVKITPEFAKMFNILPELTKPVGIMLGIYDKSDDTIEYQAIQCDALDKQTTDMFGNEQMVILS